MQPYTTADLTPWQGEGSRINQATVMLRHSYRFGGAIGQLAMAVNRGEIEQSLQQLRASEGAESSLRWVQLKRVNDNALKTVVIEAMGRWLKTISVTGSGDEEARQLLQQLRQFQLLCALKEGEWGASEMNRHIKAWLQQADRVASGHEWYVGRPVIVLRNNYALGLMNGDVGITLRRADGQLRVAFERLPKSGTKREIQWVLPSRLGEVESSYALTVHKSQGSEFDHCALLLPPYTTPLLTRELLYTAITRAKSRFTLFAAKRQVLAQCIENRILRSSGLAEGL